MVRASDGKEVTVGLHTWQILTLIGLAAGVVLSNYIGQAEVTSQVAQMGTKFEHFAAVLKKVDRRSDINRVNIGHFHPSSAGAYEPEVP